MHTTARSRVVAFAARGILTASCLAASCLFASAARAAGPSDQVSIRSVAPSSTFLLINADDVAGAVAKFQKTPLWALWNSETVQTAVGDDWKKAQKENAERLEKLGLPADTLSLPKSGGIALFTEKNEELDQVETRILVLADWGENADKMGAFFDAAFADRMKEHPERLVTKEIHGRKATILKLRDPKKGGEPDFRGMGPSLDFLTDIDTLVYARDGSRFLVALSEDSMDDALGAIDTPRTKQLNDQQDFRGTADYIGNHDVYAVLRTGPFASLAEQQLGGPASTLQPFLTQLFGDIQGYGFGLDVDGRVGMLEASAAIYIPDEKAGLMTLLHSGSMVAAPPVVPQDAMGYGQFGFSFDGLMRVLEGAAASLPAEAAGMIEPMLQNYGPPLTKAFAALGPDIHTFTTVSQPVGPESRRTTIAIACSSEQAVTPVINLFGDQVGLKPRDFLGQTIFSGEDSPMAIGFGGGYMILGNTAMVEQCLRSTSQGGAAAPSRPAAQKSAMSALSPGQVVSWGWVDTAASWDADRQLMLAGGHRDGRVDELLQEQGQNVKELTGFELTPKVTEALGKLDAAFLSKYVGPETWELRNEGKGYRYHFYLLRPAGEP